MATMTKKLLSGSTNGRPIKLTDTSTSNNTDAGYLVHTACSGTDDLDEVWVWATNTDTSQIRVVLEWGGVSAPDDHIVALIPAESTVLMAPGLLLQNGLNIKAFAGTANKVVLTGYVNFIDAA